MTVYDGEKNTGSEYRSPPLWLRPASSESQDALAVQSSLQGCCVTLESCRETGHVKAFSPLRIWRSLQGIIGLSIITCSQATIRDVITDLLWFESNVLLGLKFWVLGPQLLLHIWGLWGFGRYNWTGRSESLAGLWRLYLTLFLGLMDSAAKAGTETSRKQWTKRHLFPSKLFHSGEKSGVGLILTVYDTRD